MSEYISSIFLIALPLVFLSAGWWAGREQRLITNKTLQVIHGAVVSLFLLALGVSFFYDQASEANGYIATSPLRFIILALIIVMSLCLTKFSLNYMAGDPSVKTYWRWLFNTLSAVTLVIISNHLLIFWIGWVSISLALHHLLTLYPDRPRALLAAHKKFLLARIAECLLLLSIVLLYWSHNTFMISELMTHFDAVAREGRLSLTPFDQMAAVLIAITALIKCAQLPVHGWLIKVVEVPTPVSALLHAGVINLGGFLLMLFAPLLMQVPAATWLVLVVAGLSTIISALIMTTRISFKVNLAWSTSAQMGLMLLECALGLFELALLHLVAHSAYKANAFLNSGSAVYDYLQQSLTPQTQNPSGKDWLVSAIFVSAVIISLKSALNDEGVWAMWFLMGLGLTSLIAHRKTQMVLQDIWKPILVVFALLFSYISLKFGFSLALPEAAYPPLAGFSLPDLWVMLMFSCLFLTYFLLQMLPAHPWVQNISRLLFAGLYLDEWLTRNLLRIWPLHYSIHAMNKTHFGRSNLDQNNLDQNNIGHKN